MTSTNLSPGGQRIPIGSPGDLDPILPGLAGALASALGSDPTGVSEVVIRPADHTIDNMTTESLHHVEVIVDGGSVRLFAKVLRPATKSPIMAFIPPEHHDDVAANLNWLDEPRLYRSGVGADLPAGLRLPVVHGIAEEADRIVIWLEDVADVVDWDLHHYRDAARLLGAASARWPERRLESVGIGRRSYAYLFFGKLMNADVPVLRSPGHWSQPDVVALQRPDLGDRTERVIAAAPRLLGLMGELPHALAHGDATMHNLLPTASGDMVAIDWSYGCADAMGADLGQLFAGGFDRGHADPHDAEAIASAVRSGYLEGLGEGGLPGAAESDVDAAWAIALAFRSVISATVLDHRPDLEGDERAELLERRAAVAGLGLDLLERLDLI